MENNLNKKFAVFNDDSDIICICDTLVDAQEAVLELTNETAYEMALDEWYWDPERAMEEVVEMVCGWATWYYFIDTVPVY